MEELKRFNGVNAVHRLNLSPTYTHTHTPPHAWEAPPSVCVCGCVCQCVSVSACVGMCVCVEAIYSCVLPVETASRAGVLRSASCVSLPSVCHTLKLPPPFPRTHTHSHTHIHTHSLSLPRCLFFLAFCVHTLARATSTGTWTRPS